jgi:hypothetical protein
MDGLFFDFENNDIVLQDNGSFKTSNIDAQNCAFIAMSHVCRLTKPEVGEALMAKLVNGNARNRSSEIRRAVAAVEKDGGKNVSITINAQGQLLFNAKYDS